MKKRKQVISLSVHLSGKEERSGQGRQELHSRRQRRQHSAGQDASAWLSPLLPPPKPCASSFQTCTVQLTEHCRTAAKIRVPARQALSRPRAPAPVLGCQPNTTPCCSPAAPYPARSTTLPAWLWWGFYQVVFPNTSSLPPSTLCSRQCSRCCSTATSEHFLIAFSSAALSAAVDTPWWPELLFRRAEGSFPPQPEKTLNLRLSHHPKLQLLKTSEQKALKVSHWYAGQ